MRGEDRASVGAFGFFREQQLDRELDAELAAHIELATQDYLRRGVRPPEARRQALIKLGGIEPSKESHREWRGLVWLDSIIQDLRYACRMLRRSPGVTSVAVLSPALGIGANTTIFTLIESTLLRPIAVQHPEVEQAYAAASPLTRVLSARARA